MPTRKVIWVEHDHQWTRKNRESYRSNREFFILSVFNIILQDYIERKNMWNKHNTDDDNSLGSFKFNGRGYIR